MKVKAPKMVVEPGNQFTLEQIKTIVEWYQKHNYIPGHKVICTKTGKQTHASGSWLKRKVAQYGGIRNFLTEYVATKKQGATKKKVSLKEKPKNPKAKSVSTKRSASSISKTKKSLQDESRNEFQKIIVKTYNPQPLSVKELKQYLKDSCLRPDIFLNNNRRCNNCPFAKLCSCKIKSFNTFPLLEER